MKKFKKWLIRKLGGYTPEEFSERLMTLQKTESQNDELVRIHSRVIIPTLEASNAYANKNELYIKYIDDLLKRNLFKSIDINPTITIHACYEDKFKLHSSIQDVLLNPLNPSTHYGTRTEVRAYIDIPSRYLSNKRFEKNE